MRKQNVQAHIVGVGDIRNAAISSLVNGLDAETIRRVLDGVARYGDAGDCLASLDGALNDRCCKYNGRWKKKACRLQC